MTISIGQEVIAKMKSQYRNNLDVIAREVCTLYGITINELRKGSRQRKHSDARRIISRLAYPNYTCNEIRRFLSLSNHTSVIYLLKTFNDIYDTDVDFSNYYNVTKKRLGL